MSEKIEWEKKCGDYIVRYCMLPWYPSASWKIMFGGAQSFSKEPTISEVERAFDEEIKELIKNKFKKT